MKHIFWFTSFILAPVLIFAQTFQPLWERTDATDGSTGTQYRPLPIVLTDIDHNIIVCGETYNPGPLIGFVTTKYDSSGDFLWQRTYDTPAQDIITATVTDNTGAVYVGGNSINPLTTKVALIVIKYAPDGDTLWQYSPTVVPSSYFTPSALLLDSAQNLIILSNFIDAASSNSGLLVTKLDQNGGTIWEALYDEGNYGYIGLDARWVGDNIVFWGQKGSPEGTRFIAWQVSNDGETIDTAVTEPYSDGFGRGYHIDRFGNLFIGDNAYEYKVTKFRLDGVTDWDYDKPVIFPPPIASAVDLQCITTDSAGAVYISGLYHDTIGFVGITTKLNDTGEFLWEHRIAFDGNKRVTPQSIKWLDTKLFLVTGAAYISIDSNFYEPFLAFYDRNGFAKSGISDIEGKKNQPISIAAHNNFFYLTGISSIEVPITEPNKQFLCKYDLNDIITSTSTLGSTPSIGRLSANPNPFHDKLRISVEHTAEATHCTLEISDFLGKIVLRRAVSLLPGENVFDLDNLGNLPSGAYSISFIASHRVYVGSTIKAR